MDELREEIIATKEVYCGRLLEVKVETVRLADGTEATREVVCHPGAVAVVALKDDGQVVLVRQFRLPTRKPLLEIPAGTLSPKESPEACATRELAEEIGLRPGKLEHLCSLYLAPGYSSELIHLFFATKLTPADAEADEDERLEVVEMPFGEALALAKRGEFEDAKTAVGLLLAQARQSE